MESEGPDGMSREKYWADDNCVLAETPGMKVRSDESWVWRHS